MSSEHGEDTQTGVIVPSASALSPDRWLIRTSKNKITGPFTKAEICEKVLSAELDYQDEVCQANEYWFYLHEAPEVQKWLGVLVPPRKSADEKTQTETETDTHVDGESPSAQVSGAQGSAGASHESHEEITDPDLKIPDEMQPKQPLFLTDSHEPKVERTALIRGAVGILILFAALIVVWVLRTAKG